MKKKYYSLFTQNPKACYICGTYAGVEIHHVYYGSYRKASTKYGMIVPLCSDHHRGMIGVHGGNRDLDLHLKRVGQGLWEMTDSRENFRKTFGKSYL